MNKKNEMLRYLDEHSSHDTFSKIIIYLFNHIQQISSIHINDLAMKNYVSPATITRFVKFFDFTSFQDLKKSLSEELDSSPTYTYRVTNDDLSVLKKSPRKYLENYGSEIISSINDAVQSININEADELLQSIYSHKKVFLFSYSTAVDIAKTFRSGMLYNGKLIYVSINEHQGIQLATEMDRNSLAIILSSYGGFFSNEKKVFRGIQNSGAKTYLLTQTPNIRDSTEIDKIIQISSRNNIKAGNYPLQFYIDFLLTRYVELF